MTDVRGSLLTLTAAIVLAVGVFAAPDRILPAVLLLLVYLMGLGLAGVFFVALEYATGATWSIALRRVPEAMAGTLPVAAVGVAALLASGSLYSWYSPDLHGFRAAWLDRPFVLARSAVYLLSWLVLARAIVSTSRRQDRDGRLVHTTRNRTLSAVFLVVFGLTFWLASFDWIMSLEPHWYSTMFGVYNFAGLFLGGLAAITLLTLWAGRTEPLREYVTDDRLHDLGKLLFAFSTFWMYIWFSQYMLIWYANLPEETAYYVVRMQGGWQPLLLLNITLNWVLPFVLLLTRKAKRSRGVLARVAAVLLVGRWLDLYLMIYPSAGFATPVFGLWEVALTLGAFGLFVGLFTTAFRQALSVPVRDPFLRTGH